MTNNKGCRELNVDPQNSSYTFEQKLVPPNNLVVESEELLKNGYRLGLVSAQDYGEIKYISYVFLAGNPDRRVEIIVELNPKKSEVPSLGSLSFSAGRFEREFFDLFGIVPLTHPFLRPLVFHGNWPINWHPMAYNATQPKFNDEGTYEFPFVEVSGDGIFEIPVGPVHAGLIEPGHFRFSVVGETIVKMKARLWFLHRGIEKSFEGKTIEGALELSERISGDSAVGHSLAFSLAVEDYLNIKVDENEQLQRARLLELERIYNHVSDIGALCNDVGYGVANAYAQILKEDLLNFNASLTGHRLLRNCADYCRNNRLDDFNISQIKDFTDKFEDLINLIENNSSVLDRFVGTATLSLDDTKTLGVLGVVAKGSSLPSDARYSHPFAFKTPGVTPTTEESGDVFSRYRVRVNEVRESFQFVKDPHQGFALDSNSNFKNNKNIKQCGIGIVEGWRGTIVSRVELNSDNTIKRYKIVDPSFLNWPALSVALKDTIVPDFPLANKSFNLSYSGNDL